MILFLLLGPPGSGKGYLAQRLVERYGFFHFSTGRIFRSMNRKLISTGNLVSDDIVNELILTELKKLEIEKKYKYIVLDGFPRTLLQAQFLKKHYAIRKVFLISNISYDVLISRLSSRLLCVKNDHSFNSITCPPKIPGVCDFDHSQLYQREDDKPEIIKKRLDIYNQCTRFLEDFYSNEKLVEKLTFGDDAENWLQKVGEYI